MTVTFDSDVAPGAGEQCASFLQGRLFVKKKDAKLLTPQEETKELNVGVSVIDDGEPDNLGDDEEDPLTDDESTEAGEGTGDNEKLKGVMCDIDNFEAKLRKIKRARSSMASSLSTATSIASHGGLDQKHNDDEKKLPKSRKGTRNAISDEWIPAPAPLNNSSLTLSLEAKATMSVVEVDKRKGPGGEQCVKFVVGPYADSSSDSAETPLVKTVPISNRSRSVVRLAVKAEPREWFQVVYLSDSPGDAEEARGKVLASFKATKTTKTAGKFARTVATQYAGSGTLLAPGEAAHIGVRVKAFPPSDAKRWPVQRTFVQKGKLLLTFDGKRTQVIDLQVTMLRPCVELNHAFGKPTPLFSTRNYAHDFGMSYIQVTASSTIEVRNPTRIPARWRIVHVPRKKSTKGDPMDMATLKTMNHQDFDLNAELVDDPKVFSFREMSGVIVPSTRAPAKAFATQFDSDLTKFMDTLASGKGLADTRPIQLRTSDLEHLRLGMDFRPTDTKKYLSRFVLEIEHGYPKLIKIELRGQGTLAEDRKQ